jgi:hypothetical protein
VTRSGEAREGKRDGQCKNERSAALHG